MNKTTKKYGIGIDKMVGSSLSPPPQHLPITRRQKRLQKQTCDRKLLEYNLKKELTKVERLVDVFINQPPPRILSSYNDAIRNNYYAKIINLNNDIKTFFL